MTATLCALALLLVAGGLWGGWRYSRSQYFVGEQADQVAVFRGLPGELVGVRLNELAETSDVRVADLPTFFQQQVAATIPVGGLEAAHATVAELRSRARACVARRASHPSRPSSAPSGSLPSLPTASELPTLASATPDGGASTPGASATPTTEDGC